MVWYLFYIEILEYIRLRPSKFLAGPGGRGLGALYEEAQIYNPPRVRRGYLGRSPHLSSLKGSFWKESLRRERHGVAPGRLKAEGLTCSP